MSFTAELEARHADEWRRMTRHPFIESVADGSIDDSAFGRWLVQDFLFVQGLIAFLGGLLTRSPREMQEPLGQAVVVLSEELRLFERMAQTAGVELTGSVPSPACYSYLCFLDSVALRDDFAAGLLVYWALEKAYCDAWTYVDGNPQQPRRWQEFIRQWSKQQYAEYVASLGRTVDRLADEKSPRQQERMAELYRRVVQFEYMFWNIALKADDWPLFS